MMDYTLGLMAGIDLPIPELGLTIHPPSIRDIAYMTETQFFSTIQYLCLDKEMLIQDKNISANYTNFQVFMKVLEQPENKDKKENIKLLFQILFPGYMTQITPNSLIFIKDDQIVQVDENNFDIFQGVLRLVLCINNIFQGDNVVYNPANEKAKRIADKIMEGRRKVAAQQASQNKSSVLSRYLSILSVGLPANIEDLLNLTLFQLFDQMDRFIMKMDWDIDLQVKLTGTQTNSEVRNWMDSIH